MPTGFKELADLAMCLKSVSSRKEKIKIIANFLRCLKPDEVAPFVLLITGQVLPEFDQRTLDVGGQTVRKILNSRKQTTLSYEPLTIKGIHNILVNIAGATGPGSRRAKERLLEGLFSRVGREEVEILVRMIFGEMRIGVSEGIMLEGIAEASGDSLELVRRALMFIGDIGEVARVAVIDGVYGLEKIKPHIYTPFKPMLATMIAGVEKALEAHGHRTAFEFKFDGARIQIHRRGEDVRIYSRRLSEVTVSLPDIVDLVLKEFPWGNYILEGEVIAESTDGKPLPFQDLMRRFTRVKNVMEMVNKIPLRLHLFDILFLDNSLLIDEQYSARWTVLKRIIPWKYLAIQLVTEDPLEAEKFLEEALEAGHEGLMVKRLDSRYSPGVRGKAWLKIKPTESLDLVVVAADWGSGRRRGWLSNYHLAVRDGNDLRVIGKTFKGLTDEEFNWMTNRLQDLKVSEKDFTVKVSPVLVLEVAFNEIQKSPNYPSGYALRFARVKRIRQDKNPEEADTLEMVKKLYARQFRYKGKLDAS
jgi:DNA ligase-1